MGIELFPPPEGAVTFPDPSNWRFFKPVSMVSVYMSFRIHLIIVPSEAALSVTSLGR
jgi:hypothetical protein